MGIHCDRCGVELKGEVGMYRLEIKLYADLTKSIPLIPPDENEMEIDELLEKLEGLDADFIESDVHQEFSFVLCRRCKEIFAANPLATPLDIPDDFSLDSE